jgi:ArsR family transcriptional regulator
MPKHEFRHILRATARTNTIPTKAHQHGVTTTGRRPHNVPAAKIATGLLLGVLGLSGCGTGSGAGRSKKPGIARLPAGDAVVLGRRDGKLRMLDQLRDGELSVSELAERLAAGQQNVSKHLALLADAGMLARRKDGNRADYRIADDGIFDLCEQVCGSLQAQLPALTALVGGTTP